MAGQFGPRLSVGTHRRGPLPHRRYPAPAVGEATRRHAISGDHARTCGRVVLLAPGIVSPRKDHRQGRACGASHAMAQAPPLPLIFHGKNPAPIRRTNSLDSASPQRDTGRSNNIEIAS